MMGASKALLIDLERLVPGGVETDVSLAEISRWRIGGTADVIIRPQTPEQVQALRRYFYQQNMHHIVIGMTSNLLFADEGLRVPCIQIGGCMGEVNILNHGVVQAQAGAWVPGLARKIQQAGLTGAEHICGIPGTIGGLVCMNGGSQRKGIGSAIVSVTSIDAMGIKHVRTADECQFSYRQSAYQKNNEVIVTATLQFETTKPRNHETTKTENAAAVRKEMLKILADRRKKFPRKQPNCGSVFKSDPAMYAEIGTPGAAIEKLGFKGAIEGGARVSPLHANFIVNAGGASAQDILTLIARISIAVELSTGYRMQAEVYYVCPSGVKFSADLMVK